MGAIEGCHLPSFPLAGDTWAKSHPTEHAEDVEQVEINRRAVAEKLKAGQPVTLGELEACRTKKQLLNEQDRELQDLLRDD